MAVMRIRSMQHSTYYSKEYLKKTDFLTFSKTSSASQKRSRSTKKILGAYHQYFTVKKTLESTKEATVTDGKLYLEKGWFLSLIEKYDEALESFKKALKLGEEKNEYLWLQMSLAQTELGYFDEAAQSYEKYKSLLKSE